VTDRHVNAALDDLDHSRNLLTRRLLGAAEMRVGAEG
jgi:hypothetical protein